MIYQVTPVYEHGFGIDWYHYLSDWEKLSTDKRRVADLVGIEERFLARAAQGQIPKHTDQQRQLLMRHRRFYMALILNDLVHEVPLARVSSQYSGWSRGQLQALQQSAATFSGMVTSFCSKLGWHNLELLLTQFQSRLSFGVQQELCHLVRVSLLNGYRARVLYNAGFRTLASLASAAHTNVAVLLRNAVPFHSEKKAEGEAEYEVTERKKSHCIWLTGKKGLTVDEAAKLVIKEAKQLLEEDVQRQLGLNFHHPLEPNTAGVPTDNENPQSLDDSFESEEEATARLQTATKSTQPPSTEANLTVTAAAPVAGPRASSDVDPSDVDPSCVKNGGCHSLPTSNIPASSSSVVQALSQSENATSLALTDHGQGSSFSSKRTPAVTPLQLNPRRVALFGAASSPITSPDLFSDESSDESSELLMTSPVKSEEEGAAGIVPSQRLFEGISMVLSQRLFEGAPQELVTSTPESARHHPRNAERGLSQGAEGGECPGEGDAGRQNLTGGGIGWGESSEFDMSLRTLAILDKLVEDNQGTRDKSAVKRKGSLSMDHPGLPKLVKCEVKVVESLEGGVEDSNELIPPTPPPGPDNHGETETVNKAFTEIQKSSANRSGSLEDGVIENGCSSSLQSSAHPLQSDRDIVSEMDFDEESSSSQSASPVVTVTDCQMQFDAFAMKWKSKKCYSLYLVCKSISSKDTIGKKFSKKATSKKKNLSLADETDLKTEEAEVIGVVISWDGRKAYHISLDKSQTRDTCPKHKESCATAVSDTFAVVKSILESTTCATGEKVSKQTYNLKQQTKLWSSACGIVLEGRFEDPKIAVWLLDPEAKEKSLEAAATHYIPHRKREMERVFYGEWTRGQQGGLDNLLLESSRAKRASLINAAAFKAILIFHLMKQLASVLHQEGLFTAFETVEMPVVGIVAGMELNGMGFQSAECERQREAIESRMAALKQKAFALAGHPFSISSPENVAQVLFVELKLPPGASTDGDGGDCMAAAATGSRQGSKAARLTAHQCGRKRLPKQFSTSKEVLERLREQHQLPSIILEWRKLSSTVSRSLVPLCSEKSYCQSLRMERLYQRSQMHTVTGRITFSEPSLQNIPKNFTIEVPPAEGESAAPGLPPPHGLGTQPPGTSAEQPGSSFCISVRQAFVPFEGGVLLSADYSQLELRILAHLSGDPKLLEVLNGGGDVFKMIAAGWKGVGQQEVTAVQRQHAKHICYGIIYGMGHKTLAEQLSITEEEASEFINTFNSQYTEISAYIEETVQRCRQKGYVETMAGRRRYLPHINSRNSQLRAQAQRQAINTSVQGSAADLVKMAMARVEGGLRAARFEGSSAPTRYNHRHRAPPPPSPAEGGDSPPPPPGAYLVLQMHDELLYEVNSLDLAQVASIVRGQMQSAVQLSVCLPVNLKAGPNWASLQHLQI